MKKSTISAIAAVSAAGVVALSLGAVTDWYKNWDGSTWFNYWGKGAPTVEEPVTPDTPDDPNTDKDTDTKDGAIVTEGDNNGIMLTAAKLPRAAYAANGVSAQADTAYIITATVEPAEATNKSVTFTAAWANADSAWATDKTVSDYVTVTASDNTATVECKQAFGEQVVITCRSRDNSEIYSTCTVDYSVKITDCSFSCVFVTGIGADNVVLNAGEHGIINFGTMYAFGVTPTKTFGSLGKDFDVSITLTPAPEIMALLPGATAKTISVNDNDLVNIDESFISGLFGSGIYGTSAFYNACKNTMSSGAIRVDVSFDGTYDDYSYRYFLHINPDSVKVKATNVSLDNSNIIF